jgi:hypothetical protein
MITKVKIQERRERGKCMQRALEIEKNGVGQKLNVFSRLNEIVVFVLKCIIFRTLQQYV